MTVTDTPLHHANPYKGSQVARDDRLGRPTTGERNITSGLRVYSKSQCGFLHFLGGHCGMEIAVLLLLTVPLTAASPLRPTHRSDADVAQDAVHSSGVKSSEATQEEHAPLLKIIPFQSEEQRLDMDALKHSLEVRLRPRRAPQRGCQFGTCQLHNLADTLYQISKTSGKDESKRAHDPQGYGR